MFQSTANLPHSPRLTALTWWFIQRPKVHIVSVCWCCLVIDLLSAFTHCNTSLHSGGLLFLAQNVVVDLLSACYWSYYCVFMMLCCLPAAVSFPNSMMLCVLVVSVTRQHKYWHSFKLYYKRYDHKTAIFKLLPSCFILNVKNRYNRWKNTTFTHNKLL